MKLFRRKKAEVFPGSEDFSRSRALECRPVKNQMVTESVDSKGFAMLNYPLALKPWLLALAVRTGLRARDSLVRKLQLDEMGTLTWKLVDGNRTVADIIEILSRKYHLNRREAEIAVSSFLRELGKRGLIGFQSSEPLHDGKEEGGS
ncbi:MAG: PqqD family protein [Deltaproteobacteria bacterium]|nr:PqqD family protein [Deltaproteobacteria bacterium]MBW2071325.1 PqqD family protein [Deltaproteobacteria bacterium]